MQRSTEADPIAPKELFRMIRDERDVLLVDVREPSEHADWKIPGSLNLPLGTLEAGASPPEAERVVVYCATGPRSVDAQRILARRGIAARYLEGGMTAWNGVYDQASLATSGGAEIVQVQRVGKGCLSYVLVKDGEAVVVDPTADLQEYLDVARSREARIVAVVDTHAHADHASGSRALADATGAPYYAPDEVGRVPHTPLQDGAEIPLSAARVRVVETPGHTPGSVTLLLDDVALTGDTLFVDSVGRPDLGQDAAVAGPVLWRTLREKLRPLPGATRILPGHRSDAADHETRAIEGTLDDLVRAIPALSWDEGTFVSWVMRNALPKPANFETIKRINQGLARVEAIEAVRRLEAGPNRCAVTG